MKGTYVLIKNIMEFNTSVITRFEILLWLSGCKNIPGLSRNGPLVTKIGVLVRKFCQQSAVRPATVFNTPSCALFCSYSAAGPWLKYRGHLDNISNNMFIGWV